MKDTMPGDGTFKVTIRIERGDGQFVTVETTVAAYLASPAVMAYRGKRPVRDIAQSTIAPAFIDAYIRLSELPE